MNQDDATILVIGATGTQGGAVARALLAAGVAVRALTRSPTGAAAGALAAAGAGIAGGDLFDPPALAVAMQGVRGVFCVLRPDMDGGDAERRGGIAAIAAARAAGVPHFVHSSVCQAGEHERFPRWDEGYWSVPYWRDKWDVEQMVRHAGFPAWTILRPTFIMENFTRAKARFLFPQLADGELLTPIGPDARIQLIDAADIGAVAARAFAEPERFNGMTIDLVGDDLTMPEMADALTTGLARPIRYRQASPDEALGAGIGALWVRSQEWVNVVGYDARPGMLPGAGVPPTSFAAWIDRSRDAIDVAGG